jgi:predicted transport protein
MYIPKIGDSVAARRKIESKIYKNLIVGPVIDTWENACRIVTNVGTDCEGDFKLHFSDWNFQYLHKTNQDQEIN